MWAPSGVPPPHLSTTLRPFWLERSFTVLGAPVGSRGEEEEEGSAAEALNLLLRPGAFVGKDAFVREQVQRRADAALRLARLSLRTLADADVRQPAAQVVGLLLRLCILTRLLHFYRGHLSPTLLTVAQDFDTALREVAAEVWRARAGWPAWVEAQVRLPTRHGGMGLWALAVVGPAACLGSWALVLPLVQRLLGEEVNLGSTAETGGEIARVRRAEQRWTAKAGVQPGPVVDWAAVARTPEGLPKVQRQLSLALDDAQALRFRALRPAWNWVRLLNCGGPWASLWLTVPPAEHFTSLLDVEYAALV